MEQAKVTIALIVAVVYEWVARSIAEPLAYVDLPLIVIVYAALQGNTIRALLFATIAGVTVDALSGGLLGANGFSKTLVVYIISEVARRVYLENLLLRLLVLAGASFLSSLVYYFSHRLFGQDLPGSAFEFLHYTVLGTVVVGVLVFLILDNITAERLREAKKSEFLMPRRQARRRNPIRLGRKI